MKFFLLLVSSILAKNDLPPANPRAKAKYFYADVEADESFRQFIYLKLGGP